MAGHLVIRKATKADADEVFDLARELATSFRPEWAAFEESFARLLIDTDALLLVAEEDGVVRGYLLGFDHFTFYANGRVSWVEEIIVRSDARRKGRGAALMAEFEHRAAERGSRLIALATRRADAFYSALGYEESATYFRKLLAHT